MVDTVVINSQPPAEDPKHVEEMIKKVDEANQAPADENTPQDTPQEDRPGWLPEKFKSPEDLAKAYEELQKKLGGKSSEQEPLQDNTAQDEKPLAGYDPSQHEKSEADNTWEVETYGPALKEIFDKAGIKASVISSEFHSTGQFPDYAYAKLEEAGFSRAVVDGYLSGQQQKASYQNEVATNEIKSSVGGEQTFNEMVQWAAANLSPAEIQAYNKAVDSGDKDVAKLAVQGLYSRFSVSRPAEPKLVRGGTSGSTTGESYESIAQLTKDMASPEYKSDPAFRAKVQSKLSRSAIL
jgi:hypothetical protein